MGQGDKGVYFYSYTRRAPFSETLIQTRSPLGSSISIDTVVTSSFFDVINGGFDLDLTLLTYASFGDTNAELFRSGQVASGAGEASSDFFSTVKIAQVLGFNAAGQQISLYTAKGSNGDVLNAIALPNAPVPEPASWAMIVGGMALAGSLLRDRRRPAVTVAGC